jgi:fucose permease
MATKSTGTITNDFSNGNNKKYGSSLAFLTSLFFMWGFITCLNDIMIPHLKNIFELNYTLSSLIQFMFFGAYFLMSLPAGKIIGKIGYQKGIVLGLLVTGFGAFMFFPASKIVSYAMFLGAFFILSSGITILQVAANPFASILGPPETASSRLNLTQAYNSLGTTIAPLLGALLILGASTYYPIDTKANHKKQDLLAAAKQAYAEKYSINAARNVYIDKRKNVWFQQGKNAVIFEGETKTLGDPIPISNAEKLGEIIESGYLVEISADGKKITVLDRKMFEKFRDHEVKSVQWPYLGITLVLILMAVLFMVIKLPKIQLENKDNSTGDSSAWEYRHLVLGAAAIFVYVGAEVAIGSFLVNYFAEIKGFSEQQAGKYVAMYWGGAMIGRFLGSVSLSGKESRKKMVNFIGIVIFAAFIAFFITTKLDGAIKNYFGNGDFLVFKEWASNIGNNIFETFIFLSFVVLNMVALRVGKGRPNITLSIFAFLATILVIVSVISASVLNLPNVAVWSIISVGLFNSIMFPTIFTLGIKDLGKATDQGSGILCMAIVGGAVMTFFMGILADLLGIRIAFILTTVCYGYIAYYGIKGYRYKKLALQKLKTHNKTE